MKLSKQAILDLRAALRKSYGQSFDISMNDEQINRIGYLILTGLTEGLKIKVSKTIS